MPCWRHCWRPQGPISQPYQLLKGANMVEESVIAHANGGVNLALVAVYHCTRWLPWRRWRPDLNQVVFAFHLQSRNFLIASRCSQSPISYEFPIYVGYWSLLLLHFMHLVSTPSWNLQLNIFNPSKPSLSYMNKKYIYQNPSKPSPSDMNQRYICQNPLIYFVSFLVARITNCTLI